MTACAQIPQRSTQSSRPVRAAFEDRPLAGIEPHEIDRYLREKGVKPLTRNTIALRLGVFFEYAKEQGWVQVNPVHGMTKAKVAPHSPGILTVEETARLLEAASEETLPFIAMGAFAGIRTAELERLEWKDIHWEEKLIEVSALSARQLPAASSKCSQICSNGWHRIAWTKGRSRRRTIYIDV